MNGALIALTVKQPALAIPLSFVSHYVTDAIPHYGPKMADDLSKLFKRNFKIFVTVDFGFSLILMAILGLLFPSHVWLIWACMITAAIPDAVWWSYRKSINQWPEALGKFSRLHSKLNLAMHVRHFYFDAIWFAAAWTAVLLIRFK